MGFGDVDGSGSRWLQGDAGEDAKVLSVSCSDVYQDRFYSNLISMLRDWDEICVPRSDPLVRCDAIWSALRSLYNMDVYHVPILPQLSNIEIQFFHRTRSLMSCMSNIPANRLGFRRVYVILSKSITVSLEDKQMLCLGNSSVVILLNAVSGLQALERAT